MLKIGITGGIGTGKTTACKLFEQYNIPVYYADDRAKWLMNNDETLRAGLIEHFGKEVFDKNQQLNRAYLGNIIFQDERQLEVINRLVHPAVKLDSEAWQLEQAKKNVPYTLKEAALLFESGSYQYLDKIIVVTAPQQLRIERVMKRDNCTQEQVLARMSKQLPQEQKEVRADFLLHNIELPQLKEQVALLHQTLCKGI